MKLEINERLYNCTDAMEMYLDVNESYPLGMKVIYKPIVYIFDWYSFIVCRKDSEEAESIENPIIFPDVTPLEVQKAYVKSLNSRKLNNIFNRLSDEEYSKVFWEYFDDGWQNLIDYNMFERKYRLNRIAEWCEENYIPYYFNKKDEFIKRTLDYKINH